MAYTLQTSQQPLVGGKNILASEHLQFIEGGATLDATKFPVGTIALGTPIARNTTSGKFEPANGLASDTGYDNFSILNIDVVNDGVNDTVVGEVIVRGSVYESKLPVVPSATVRGANKAIRYVKHI